MSLLVKIAELLLLYAIVRSVIRMWLPAKRNDHPQTERKTPAARFDEKECDISDADYEEVE